MNYRDIITIEAGKRAGRPSIRGMRIAVADVLGWLAAGMSHQQIIADYPELTEQDIRIVSGASSPRNEVIVRSEPQHIHVTRAENPSPPS